MGRRSIRRPILRFVRRQSMATFVRRRREGGRQQNESKRIVVVNRSSVVDSISGRFAIASTDDGIVVVVDGQEKTRSHAFCE